MKLYRFDPDAGRPINAFDSTGLVLSRLVRLPGPTQLGCMHLAPGGVVGNHQATCPQLFLVVQGEGFVRGGEGERVPIKAGQAAFWVAGEWHETASETGLTAVVVEGEELNPSAFMPEVGA